MAGVSFASRVRSRLLLGVAATWTLMACGGSEAADRAPNFDGPFASTGGAGGASGAPGGAAGSSSGQGGSAAGLGGASSTAGTEGGNAGASGGEGNPNGGSNAARVGAESCPGGPYGSPLPANVNELIEPIAAVGENAFFNWEGLVWTGEALYFSEIGNGDVSRINRYTPGGSVERGVIANTGSNGLALDAAGDLLLAAHDVGGISRVALPTGNLSRGSQTFDGLRFNSPNDLVLRGDGNLYFTDPDFLAPSGRIQGATRVYRLAPAAPGEAEAVSVVDDSLEQPNGITLSPDGNTLYVAGGNVLRRYTLDAQGAATPLGDARQRLEVPDGMAVDCAGNVYAVENEAKRIRVFSGEGELAGTIGPEGFEGSQGLTNLAFGGPNRATLYVSGFTQGAQPGLYSVELNVPGLPY